jgi:hypothetical protein
MERRYITEDEFFKVKLQPIGGVQWVNYCLHPYPQAHDNYVAIVNDSIHLYVDDRKADYQLS